MKLRDLVEQLRIRGIPEHEIGNYIREYERDNPMDWDDRPSLLPETFYSITTARETKPKPIERLAPVEPSIVMYSDLQRLMMDSMDSPFIIESTAMGAGAWWNSNIKPAEKKPPVDTFDYGEPLSSNDLLRFQAVAESMNVAPLKVELRVQEFSDDDRERISKLYLEAETCLQAREELISIFKDAEEAQWLLRV